MIEPYEMAQIYWHNLRDKAMSEVADRINHMSPTALGRDYWAEVYTFLSFRKHGKRGMQ